MNKPVSEKQVISKTSLPGNPAAKAGAKRGYNPDSPILPPAASRMMVDIIINENSDVWILHDKSFTEVVKWAEYDLGDNKLVLVLLSGKMQELGIRIPNEMREYLRYGQKIFLVQMQNKKIADCGQIPLLVRDLAMN